MFEPSDYFKMPYEEFMRRLMDGTMDTTEKDGYTQSPMYEDKYGDMDMPMEWPPEDESKAAENHRRRCARNKRDENTR